MRVPAYLAELGRPDRRPILAGGVVSGYVVTLIFLALLILADAAGVIAAPGPLYGLVAAKLVTNTLAGLSLRLGRFVMLTASVNVAMDIVVMTAAIYFTGSTSSPLYAIYVVEIAVLAMLTNAGVTALAIAGGLVLYGMVVLGEILGWWPSYPPPAVLVTEDNRAAYMIVKYAFDTVVLATVAVFLIRNLARLEDREAKLRKQADDLVEAAREKSEFMANVTHELRTPIFGISGLCDLLEAGAAGSLSDKQRHFVGQIRRSGQNLLHLVDSLLQLAKAEAARVEFRPEPIDLREWIPQVVAGARWMVGTRDLRLVVDLPEGPMPTLHSDRGKLNHVLLNLLSNAIKVSPEGGTITLFVEPGDEGVVFSVKDEGPGIAPEDQRRVFESFEQGDGSDERPYGGLGIGLSLVRRLVAVMGGNVTVESEVGRGATFHVFVPFEAEPRVADPRDATWEAVVSPERLRKLRDTVRAGGGRPTAVRGSSADRPAPNAGQPGS
ncbi:MAG: sensor histidine kinase [Deltaproteobacteria bacterium]|nr:MAG: sensor histidine kinase [Deltaproteobacteria bacterium]